MRTLRVIASAALLALLLTSQPGRSLSSAPVPQSAQAVDVKVVKYAGLCELVEQNKGKVVLLDFWSTTCKPCKESFFHTVEMYNKYRDKGLAVISVSTFQLNEDYREDVIMPAVLQYLRSQNATFTNVILDELPPLIQEKLRITSIPCLYVFNRQGQWTQFRAEDLKPDASHRHVNIEQYVQYLLEKK
jgi:thiol-disulfide isomerase/thioredoxin